jgi:hypothetical protein
MRPLVFLPVLLIAGLCLYTFTGTEANAHEKHQHSTDTTQTPTTTLEVATPPPPRDTLAFHQSTISGEVIDITCYLRHDGSGQGHAQCALDCANMGMPVGILENKTNKIYLIVPTDHGSPQEPVLSFFGKQVKVDAVIYQRGGLSSLEIQDINEIH